MASSTAVTLVVRVTVVADQGLPPPMASVWPVAAAFTVASDRRAVRPPGVPFQSAAGTKRRLAVAGRTSAFVSDRSVGSRVQVAPSVEYHHWPWPAVAALPTTATPASVGVWASAPPGTPERSSAASP